MAPLQPNVPGPQTKLDLHLHMSQQRLLTLTSPSQTTALRVPPISQQQSKELLQWNVTASSPGSLAMGPFAVLQANLLNSCRSYVPAAETCKNPYKMFSWL